MLETRIARAAEGFWRQAGMLPTYPVDIQAAVLWALPLDIHLHARLSVRSIQEWTAARGIRCRLPGRDRRLRGCLIAQRGGGILFVDGADPPEEQRFTLAHEAAHFLLDYDEPRRQALATLGPAVLPVLDGERAPTADERVSAILAGMVFGVHTHLMDRGPHGALGADVAAAESAADALALELLAPAALAGVLATEGPHVPFPDRVSRAGAAISRTFGLPAAIAAPYARRLLREHGHAPSFSAWLGLPERR